MTPQGGSYYFNRGQQKIKKRAAVIFRIQAKVLDSSHLDVIISACDNRPV